MVTQLDETRRHLWERAKANLQKAQKWYKDFSSKFQHEVHFEQGMKCGWISKVFSYQIVKPRIFMPICKSIPSAGKHFF
jgi:hypothetical protein